MPCRCLIVLDNVWDCDVVNAFGFNDSWATIIITARELKVLPFHERESHDIHYRLTSFANSKGKADEAAPDLKLLTCILKGEEGSFEDHEKVQHLKFLGIGSTIAKACMVPDCSLN